MSKSTVGPGPTWHFFSTLSGESPDQCLYKHLRIITISSNLLLKKPLATQCVTSAILFASGDIIAQQAIERKREKHDVRVTHHREPASVHSYIFSI
jgi:hypothetical protein